MGTSLSTTGVPPTNNLFLIPGTVTADNGAGGADVPAFTASVTLPGPALSFDNIDSVGPNIDRTQGVTVNWSGGDPNGFVNIVGTSTNVTGTATNNVTLQGSFSCTAPVSAGTFTVPSFVTLAMPVSKSVPPLTPIGTIGLWNYVVQRFTVPGLDLALMSVVWQTQRGTPFI